MKVGDYVQLFGLQKAQQHNGSVGVITQRRADRWVVKKHTGEVLAICDSNLSTTIRLPMLSSDETRDCLGGGEFGINNNFVNDNIHDAFDYSSTFYRLERPSAKDLPGPRFEVLPIANKMLKETYLKIYRGEFEVSYDHIVHPGTLMIHFKISVNEHKDIFDILIGNFAGPCAHGKKHDRNFWGDSLDSIDDRLARDLYKRILHLIARSAGTTHLGKDATMVIVRHCCTDYGQFKWHKEDLDCSILLVDVLLCSLPTTTPVTEASLAEVGYGSVRVGEILESLGRFVEAAQLYLYITQVYYKGNAFELIKGQCNAALAYKRARDFESSEQYSILALHNQLRIAPQDWDAHGLDKITTMYWDWALTTLSSTEDIRVGGQCTELDAMNWIWNILLELSGSKAGKFTYNCSRTHIKREFWSQHAANAAIKSALESGNVADFRSKILACASDVAKNKNGSFVMDEALVLAYKSDKAPSHRAEKERARKDQQQRDSSSLLVLRVPEDDEPARTRCDNPVCNVIERDKLFLCPCHKAQYCGRECQKVHWQSHHKHVCLLSKKNRKKQVHEP